MGGQGRVLGGRGRTFSKWMANFLGLFHNTLYGFLSLLLIFLVTLIISSLLMERIFPPHFLFLFSKCEPKFPEEATPSVADSTGLMDQNLMITESWAASGLETDRITPLLVLFIVTHSLS